MTARKTTKKGIILTAAIVGGIVAASFLVYLIPTSPTNDVARISDPGTELAFVFDRKEAIVDEFQSAFDAWENDELSKDEFDERANTAVDQVDVLMLELRRSGPPEEWAQSYVLYIEALDNYKAYFEKTKEYVANSDPSKGETLLDSMSELLAKADDLAQQSEDAMPA